MILASLDLAVEPPYFQRNITSAIDTTLRAREGFCMERRYTALRIISILNKIAAIIVLAVTIVLFFGALWAGNEAGQLAATYDPATGQLLFTGVIAAAFFGLARGIIAAVALWAAGELIMLLIHCEEHLRGMHDMMFYRREGQGAAPAPARRNLWEES